MNFVKRLVTRLAHGEVSRLDELYQRHAGEECYLFGDGISLKWMDLTQFTDRVSIMGPMGLFHKEASALRIPYYALIEPFLFSRLRRWAFYGGATRLQQRALQTDRSKSPDDVLRQSVELSRCAVFQRPVRIALVQASGYNRKSVSRSRGAICESRRWAARNCPPRIEPSARPRDS